jgi:hypothetical protein
MTYEEAFSTSTQLAISNAHKLGTLKGMVKVLEIDRAYGNAEMVEKAINEMIEYVRKLDEERGE